jgi:hypothetical protein
MAAEFLPLLVEMLARAAKEGIKVKVSDEHEGVLIEADQEGLRWLVDPEGTILCDDCGFQVEGCEC